MKSSYLNVILLSAFLATGLNPSWSYAECHGSIKQTGCVDTITMCANENGRPCIVQVLNCSIDIPGPGQRLDRPITLSPGDEPCIIYYTQNSCSSEMLIASICPQSPYIEGLLNP